MKKLFVVILLLSGILTAAAGNSYTVFIIKGKVTAIVDGKTHSLQPNDIVTDETVITVQEGGVLSLRSADKKRLTLTIKKPFHGKVRDLRKEGEKKKHSSRFMKMTQDKTGSDFVRKGKMVMSRGGYNTRDIFEDEKEEKAIMELKELLEETDMIENSQP